MALFEKLEYCDQKQLKDLIDSLEESNQQNIANDLKTAFKDHEDSRMGSSYFGMF